MDRDSSTSNHEQKLGKLLQNDLRRRDLGQSIKRDYRELREFYIDENRKKQLEHMHWFKRAAYTFTWLLKSLFLKLTPARRILLLLGIVLLIISHNIQYQGEQLQVNFNFSILGGLIFLFVLMLELKDKLLARNELEAGRAVQKALMPEQTPELSGWSVWLFTKTANEVGGDLVDFQKLGENKYGISLGDVSGNGLTAALLMAKLQATLRAIAPDTDSPAELGSKLNKILYRDRLRKIFASLLYIELRSDSGLMHIMNAGHYPPIIVRGTKIEEMPKGEPAIGIFPEVTYSEKQIELQTGDILIVYSDGLTDAKNNSGEFFDTQRLIQLLPSIREFSAPQIGKRIVDEVDSFIASAQIYDDLSLVILKRLI